mgnify:CR=1 FL=1
MNDDLKKLYETLGYTGPMPDETVSFSSLGESSGELPPLDLASLEQLEAELNTNPRRLLKRVREMWARDMTLERLRKALALARRALETPNEVRAEIEVASFAIKPLPDGFDFPGMNEEPMIEINPEDRKFENDDLVGLLGWALFAGPFALAKGNKKDFLRHDPNNLNSFIYQMPNPAPGAPLEIALFADYGVGRYYSDHIARQFFKRRFPYAIHLGDVYYAGREHEFRDNFIKQIDPILGFTNVFALNSNHEMFSKGKYYFDYIGARHKHLSGVQQQEGSYFCLRSDKFQIVGIDTAFFGAGRCEDKQQLEWLGNVLREGRATNRINILLSADHPYEYGNKKPTKLLSKDLKSFALDERLVDLWFWGNTHYGALFDHRPAAANDMPALPFIGSCIGHGGYPYDTYSRGKFEPAPMIFLEDQARFPASTGIRQDKGNNGYCAMSLNADGSLRLQYIDWMSNVRFTADLSREQADKPLKIIPVVV